MDTSNNKPEGVKIISITGNKNEVLGLGDDEELYRYNRNTRKWVYLYDAPPSTTVSIDIDLVGGLLSGK